MKAFRLLKAAIMEKPETVLDVGTGPGNHAKAFLCHGAKVTGLDVQPPPMVHANYEHIQSSYERANIEDEFSCVWSSHALEHVGNPTFFLNKLRDWLRDDGFLAIAVPTAEQNRLHIGHLTLWTPAHLVYNLVCAGWDCSKALWYTEYSSIALMVPKAADIDFDGRSAMPSEEEWLNQYTPIQVKHMNNAWWPNNWPEETEPRRIEPVPISDGQCVTDIPSLAPLRIGPNPDLKLFRRPKWH